MVIKKIWCACAAVMLALGLSACETSLLETTDIHPNTQPPDLPSKESQTLYIEPEEPVILDLSQQSGGVIAFDLPIDKGDAENVLIGDTELRIMSQEEQVLVQATSLIPGEYTMTLLQEEKNVSFPVYIATMVIYDAADLQKATQLPDADTGYFILGNNIDCSELNESVCFLKDSYFETALGEGRQGFRGGFNGMGYTIHNLLVPKNGLFGCIGYPGVVRNLALKNINSPEPDACALCRDSAGIISQVYVQGDFASMMFASYGPNNKLENIVVEATRTGARLCNHIASVDTDGYSVSDVRSVFLTGPMVQISNWSRTEQFSNLIANEAMLIYSGEIQESIPTVTDSFGFNSCWDISSGYPVFISSDK